MPYSAQVFASIREVPIDAWNEIHGAYGDAFTDPRFLEIVEATLPAQFPFVPVVVFDDERRPAAIFCLSACRLDATTMAGAALRRHTGWVRCVWPNFLRFTLVLCGLPLTLPQRKL